MLSWRQLSFALLLFSLTGSLSQKQASAATQGAVTGTGLQAGRALAAACPYCDKCEAAACSLCASYVSIAGWKSHGKACLHCMGQGARVSSHMHLEEESAPRQDSPLPTILPSPPYH